MRTCPDCQNHYDDEVLHCPEDGFNLSGVEPVDELIGRTIGSYKIIKPLGKGGMGAVYRADHPIIGSKVAIKFLHPQYANDAKIVDRFFNEARAVNLIGHDNVLKISDLNITDDNRHYFIMEFLQGRALQSIVKPNQPIGLDQTGPILLQSCNALQAAHDKGIIHRDLKPDNIYLITLNGRKNFVKVVDFGIAKLTEGGVSTGKTQTGMVMGTPAYMSPEQGSGETSKIDPRSDIYSLGVMMFQMATGRLPFPGGNFGEVLMGHLQKPPPPPRSIVPEIPEEYEAVILKCLEKSQDDRYQSMNDLHDAVFAVMQTHGVSAELPLADATEELPPLNMGSPSSPGGPRTPSRPGRATNPPLSGQGIRSSNPGGKSAPRQAGANDGSTEVDQQRGRSKSQPGKSQPGRSQPGTSQSSPGRSSSGSTQPPQEPKSKLGLFIGLGAAVVVVIGGLATAVAMQSADKAATQKAEQDKEKKLAQKAKERAAEVEPPVYLSVVSDPMGAEVEATWKGDSKSGTTPLSLEVPKNTKVHFEFKKDGYLPLTSEVIADSAQTVNAPLKPSPTAAKPMAAADPAEGGDAPKKGRKGAKKDEAKPAPQKDGLIDIGDAFGK